MSTGPWKKHKESKISWLKGISETWWGLWEHSDQDSPAWIRKGKKKTKQQNDSNTASMQPWKRALYSPDKESVRVILSSFSKAFWHGLASGDNSQSKGHRIKDKIVSRRKVLGPGERKARVTHRTRVAEATVTELRGNSHLSPLRTNYFWEDTSNPTQTIFKCSPLVTEDRKGWRRLHRVL